MTSLDALNCWQNIPAPPHGYASVLIGWLQRMPLEIYDLAPWQAMALEAHQAA